MGHERKQELGNEEFGNGPGKEELGDGLGNGSPPNETLSQEYLDRIDAAVLALNNQYITFAQIISNWGN